MTDPTDKAAPIPAEVLRRAEEVAVKWLGAEHEAVPFLANDIARAIMQDRADRASQEERIREDEREACAKVVDDFGVTWGASYRSMTDEIAKAVRARQRGDAS